MVDGLIFVYLGRLDGSCSPSGGAGPGQRRVVGRGVWEGAAVCPSRRESRPGRMGVQLQLCCLWPVVAAVEPAPLLLQRRDAEGVFGLKVQLFSRGRGGT